jgi:hypothetical protein
LITDTVGFEACGHPCAPLYPFTPSAILSLPPSLRLKKERGVERGERAKKKEIEENTRTMKVLPSLPPLVMAKQDWTPSTVTPGHLQKLVKYGFMAAAKLEACCVPHDLVFLAPTDGYMVSFVTSQSILGEASPPLKRVHTKGCLPDVCAYGMLYALM